VRRWLVGVLALTLLLAAGYVVFLNPTPVTVRLTPERAVTAPLASVLLGAFAAGALAVGLAVGVRAGASGVRRWRAGRRARRDARREDQAVRARALVWAGEYGRARTELLRDPTATATDAARVQLLAESYLQEGDPASARKVLDEALVQVGLEPRLLDLLAEAAERAGDLRGAADALERARAVEPESPRLGRRLRDVYAAAGRWADAVGIQAGLLLRMHDPMLLASEEAVLRGLRYQAALAEPTPGRAAAALKAITREDPSFVPAWVSLGDILAKAGRRVAARRAWERGARRRPVAVLLERIERLNASDGRPQRSTRFYHRLQRRHPEAPAPPLLLARHLVAHGAFDEASEVLSSLPAPLAGHALVHAVWGELHRRRGNHQLAADTFIRAFGPELGLLAPFRCDVCRRNVDEWTGYCAECRHWGSYRAAAENAAG
jgi:tetratricopeptide (TPR) repeat protein